MSKIMIVYEEGIPKTYFILINTIEEYFTKKGMTVEKFCIENEMGPEKYWSKYADPEWAYICTLDMAGFQISTILGEPRYNIMSAKQIHIVINEDIFSLYRHMEFALNLYLFMPDTMRGSCLEDLFIPNLSYYKPFESKKYSKKDRRELIRLLDTVRKECETLCG